MKNLFAKIKGFYDAWKMWLFFSVALFGTNGAQLYTNHEPELEQHVPEQLEKHVESPKVINKTITIYKTDTEYCNKQIAIEFKKHLESSNH